MIFVFFIRPGSYSSCQGSLLVLCQSACASMPSRIALGMSGFSFRSGCSRPEFCVHFNQVELKQIGKQIGRFQVRIIIRVWFFRPQGWPVLCREITFAYFRLQAGTVTLLPGGHS